jgi:hypothetical protein
MEPSSIEGSVIAGKKRPDAEPSGPYGTGTGPIHLAANRV